VWLGSFWGIGKTWYGDGTRDMLARVGASPIIRNRDEAKWMLELFFQLQKCTFEDRSVRGRLCTANEFFYLLYVRMHVSLIGGGMNDLRG
jgi:hypothetical protein